MPDGMKTATIGGVVIVVLFFVVFGWNFRYELEVAQQMVQTNQTLLNQIETTYRTHVQQLLEKQTEVIAAQAVLVQQVDRLTSMLLTDEQFRDWEITERLYQVEQAVQHLQ